MSKEISDLIDEQRLVLDGDFTPVDEEATNEQFTPSPSGEEYGGQLYAEKYFLDSENRKPWMEIIFVDSSSSELELPPNKGL